ncbi:MAG: hypothetical protein H6993_08185 [Pseudomonadales bacterium]|nr:hypothetical protein [Pseudomonadales bacterium]MCP5183927.1 hypothetical protein [Pseudomonadales bacterium]
MNRWNPLIVMMAGALACVALQVNAAPGGGGGAGMSSGARQEHAMPRRDAQGATQRDRSQDEASRRDRVRDQDQAHAPDLGTLRDEDIYGHEVMSRREMNAYRNRLASVDDDAAREQLRAEHQREVRARAKEKGVDLKPSAEGPIYGGAMLTLQERNEYRARLRALDSDAARGEFLARHREEMQARAQAEGRPVESLD